jgi:hypothetical protein
MAVHNADMTTFTQWWKRSVRAGHALAQRYALNGRTPARDCAREYKSTLFWGVALPAAALATLVPTFGFSSLLLLGYPLLGFRIYRHYRRRGCSKADALLGARFGVYAKLANGVGLLKFLSNRISGSYRIIEYK